MVILNRGKERKDTGLERLCGKMWARLEGLRAWENKYNQYSAPKSKRACPISKSRAPNQMVVLIIYLERKDTGLDGLCGKLWARLVGLW
jgi:hypothetical protein